jgi:hypothetical protein
MAWQADRVDDRHHLTLTLDGEPAMQGWWASEATARRKFSSWIGERGSMPGVRITLVDEETGLLLESWPVEE